MKQLLKNIISFLTCIILKCKNNLTVKKSIIFLSDIYSNDKTNIVYVVESRLEHSKVHINGKNNIIKIHGYHSNLTINVIGSNNSICIEKNAALILSEITVRGKNCKIEIGKNSTFGKRCCIVCMGDDNIVSIGDNCMFAEQVDVWNTDSHPIFDDDLTLINHSRPVYIGNHVWIGKYCKILKGSIIDNNAIVGMSSLVTGHIVHNSLNVGTPSKCIKKGINWDRKFIDQ